MAAHLHLDPRKVDRLTVAEFHRMCAHAEHLNRES